MKEEEKRGGAMNIPVRRYTRLRRGLGRKGGKIKAAGIAPQRLALTQEISGEIFGRGFVKNIQSEIALQAPGNYRVVKPGGRRAKRRDFSGASAARRRACQPFWEHPGLTSL